LMDPANCIPVELRFRRAFIAETLVFTRKDMFRFLREARPRPFLGPAALRRWTRLTNGLFPEKITGYPV
jgi:hypothetical protein